MKSVCFDEIEKRVEEMLPKYCFIATTIIMSFILLFTSVSMNKNENINYSHFMGSIADEHSCGGYAYSVAVKK